MVHSLQTNNGTAWISPVRGLTGWQTHTRCKCEEPCSNMREKHEHWLHVNVTYNNIARTYPFSFYSTQVVHCCYHNSGYRIWAALKWWWAKRLLEKRQNALLSLLVLRINDTRSAGRNAHLGVNKQSTCLRLAFSPRALESSHAQKRINNTSQQ